MAASALNQTGGSGVVRRAENPASGKINPTAPFLDKDFAESAE